MCVWAHIWHMKAALGAVHLALCLLRGTGSLIGLELISSAGLASQRATGLSFSTSPQSSDYKKASSCPAFLDSGWSDSPSQASRESVLVTEPSPSHSLLSLLRFLGCITTNSFPATTKQAFQHLERRFNQPSFCCQAEPS